MRRARPLRVPLGLVGAAASLALAILSAGASANLRATTWTRLKASIDEAVPTPPRHAVYRSGDAAGPFGWSTVIADFNTDGQLDVAVADHVGATAGAYQYRLEFSISGQQSNHVTFETNRDAVTLSVSDVDHDNDLDLVVRTPLVGETIGVWLNDGEGHFTSTDARPASAAILPHSSIIATERMASADVESLPPRSDDALPAAVEATPAPLQNRFASAAPFFPQTRLHATARTPRAPPSARIDHLS
jgi:hypothetical protein